MPIDLSGLHILNTRPAHQAAQLKQAIEAAGAQSINVPLLNIADVEDDLPLRTLDVELQNCDIAIFVSPNAVEYGFKHLKQPDSLPKHLKLAAVGKTTARLLGELSARDTILCPSDVFNSEALLALPDMQNVAGKRIMIFRGQQGRELLAETLRQRGAQVRYVAVYRRSMPTESTNMLQQCIEENAIDIIIITSGEALHNLLTMAGQQPGDKIKQLQLLVVNKRLAEMTDASGFHKRAIVSDNATDDAIISAIQHWHEQRAGARESP